MAQASQARYEAKVADANARRESQRAIDALERGDIETRRYQRRLSQEIGQQNAALAANGIDITFGTAADVRGDTMMFGQEDVQSIQQNAFREAMGYDINAANYSAEAVARRRAAKGALIGGAFGVASTVLGGATQVANINRPRR
jgi:hypothetical protein